MSPGAAAVSSYRQTFLKLADTCPHSAKLYLETGGSTDGNVNDGGIREAPLERGKAFHEFAERAIREMLHEGLTSLTLPHARSILNDVLAERDRLVPLSDVELLRIAVSHFADDFVLPDADVHFEERVSIDLGLVEVTGKIDLWWRDGQTIHIRDWKCGFGMPPPGSVASSVDGMRRGAKAFQLVVYALAHEATYHEPGIGWYDCRFVYPLFVGLPEREVIISHGELADHSRWLEGLVARTHDHAVSGDWPAMPGKHCQYCPAPQRCPIPDDLRPVDVIDLFEDGPVDYALKAWDLQRQLDRLKLTLNGHVKEYGPVPVGEDLQWSFIDTQTGPRFGLHKREP